LRFAQGAFSARLAVNPSVSVDTGPGGMHANDHETKRNPDILLDSEPPMALDKFIVDPTVAFL
jgi:hypothetical protein